MSTQPAADDFALAEGATPLAAVIEGEIADAGRITFARFMELALGHPEHGYYARPGLAWGRDGDYETSPEVHPIFGYLWARQVAECWERLGSPAAFDLVEPGAGSGAFASAMLDWLRARAPDCYAAARVTVLDGHPARGEEQRAALAARGHEARTALLADWLAEPEPLEGVAISNELFDAFPVHLVERRGAELREWYVTSEAARCASSWASRVARRSPRTSRGSASSRATAAAPRSRSPRSRRCARSPRASVAATC